MALLGDERRWDYPGNIVKAVTVFASLVFYGGLAVIGVWALAHAFL